MAIIVRRLLQNEIAKANDFFNSVYKTNRSLEDFRWEFLEGPDGPAVYVAAIDDSVPDGRVVGIQAAIPLSLVNVQGHSILSAKSEDTLVDPSYRGQRIFERMYELLFDECKKDGIEVIWGFTPAKKAFERIQFEIPFETQQALMVFKPIKAFRYLSSLNAKNTRVDRLKIAALSFLSKSTAGLKSFGSNADLVIKKVELSGKEDTLRDLCPSSTLYHLKMSPDFITWRIKNNPFNNKYESYQVSSSGTLVADVLINFRPEGFAYVEQMIFKEQLSDKEREAVIRQIVRIIRSRANFIRVLLFDTNPALSSQIQLLKKSGFVVLRRGSHFVWRSIGDSELTPHNIFLNRLFTQGNQ